MLTLGRNDSGAGSLDSSALGGVERKEHPTGIRPSIGSSNKRPQLPGWGRCFDIRLWPLKVLVEGDHAIAAVRLPLAMVLVAVAVAIVGVVVLRGGALVNLRCPCSF